jgi:8-oxo-dGTP pyrophosphatase MutT (NUDIX family)
MKTFNSLAGQTGEKPTSRVFLLLYALDTGRFLAILRADDRTWGLPGGKVELSNRETPLEAMWRESIEEVGVNLESPQEIYDMAIGESENCKIYLEIVPTSCPVVMNETEVTDTRWSFLEEWPTPTHPGMMQLIREADRHISSVTVQYHHQPS